MAQILCMTSGLRGLLNASFELVRRLDEAGHSMRYACPHDVADAVRAQGIEYTQLSPVNLDPAPRPPGGRLLGRFTKKASAAARRRAGVEALGMSAFESTVERLAPDLVLLDAELYEHSFALHAMGVRVALLTPFFAQWPGRGLPPLALSATPADRAAIEAYRAQRAARIAAVSQRFAFTERRQVLLAYAESVGYPIEALEQVGALTLFVDTHLPTLLLTAAELDFVHDVPAHATYVGPMVAPSRADVDTQPGEQARLDQVLDAHDGGPLIYCPLTTMQVGDGGLLERLITALSARKDWTLIVAGVSSPLASEPPPNVHVFGYVRQMQVLPKVDLCITMAGMNTVHEALLLGTRLLACPGHYDQPGVAARLAARGLAHVARPDADAAALGEHIAAALADDALGAAAAQAPQMFDRYREARLLEQRVQELLDHDQLE